MVTHLTGDCRLTLPTLAAESVHCCVTSPPYWGLRDYGCAGQIGLERTPEAYVAEMVAVFREVRRVLTDDGTLWLNLGSSYAHDNPSGPQGKTGDRASRTFTAAGCGGKRPNQSLPLPRVPACGTDGKALPDSQAAGRACPGSDDECQGETPNRHPDTARSVRCGPQGEPQTLPTDHDTGRSDCGQETPDASLPGALASTMPRSSVQPSDASDREATASACPSTLPTSAPDVSPSVHSSCEPPIGLTSLYSTIRHTEYKQKDLVPIPWLVAMALQADGWYLRQDIIWHKPNPMPESVTDRCTKAHEYIFLLSKSARYYYDAEAIKEPATGCENRNGFRGENDGPTHYANQPAAPNNSEKFTPRSWNGSAFHDGKNLETHPNVGKKRPSVKRGGFNGKTESLEGRNAFRAVTETRNKRSVWTVATAPYSGAHFATFPPALIRPCILAGCPVGGTVLDPFGGSGTTGEVAEAEGRNSILCELNPAYVKLAGKRAAQGGLFCASANPGEQETEQTEQTEQEP